MVSVSDALSVENAGSYYRAHYSAVGEYYAPTGTLAIGQAVGEGAETLGLAGPVTAEQFEALLHGIDPNSGAVLRTGPSRSDAAARAGFDLTFSPPKSVSIQALVAGDARLIEAARNAALRALQEAERCALARQHGGSEWVQTSNICAVVFEHYDARESINGEHGPMPQLHHHSFVTNLTRRPDGQWRSLDAEQIYKARGFADGVYMSELARNVQQLGYQISRGPRGGFELAGYTREQIEAFSERCQDIERLKAERGITNARAAREIIIETRKSKRQHDPEALKVEREALAARHGINLNHQPTTPARSFAIAPEAQAERSLQFALAHTTNRHAVPDYREIVTTALRNGVGATDLDHLAARIEKQRSARELIAAEKSHLHPLGSFTTAEMIRLERENLALVRDQINRGQPITGIPVRSALDGSISTIGTQPVRAWTAASKLLSDQADAVLLTLTTPKWASAIEGLAGTTKTTTVGAVKEFAETQGWTVRGFGTTSGSVNALAEAGIESRTIAKALAVPLPPKSGSELWIVDESSLLATRPVNSLLKLAHQRGIERIVFVGDQKQHLAIEAGSPVRQFLADNLAVARLTTIRRQQDPELRRAVELAASERIGEAIDLLTQQNRVTAIPDTAKRYDRIAADYLQAYEAGQRCLVVSPANDERKAINNAIRSALVAHNYVAGIGQEHQFLIRRDLTPAQLRDAHSYHEGDMLYFRRGSKRQQIPKGAYLTVSAVNETSLTLTAENGRRLEFDPSRLKGVQAYSAESRTIAVGDRLQWREPDNQRRIANGEYATITKLDPHQIEVQLDKGRKLSMPLAEARKVDLGYASTSHAAQGATVDRVLVNIDSSRSAQLVNDRMCYVAISRARLDARIYTDDRERLRRA
ncbi:MAG TPA: MobF family relaxase, partial [Candidatus Binataceae bacterium]|nr:MobF family relaxase [Candidatus Binataceae bacterium]